MAKKITEEEERALVSNIGAWRKKRHIQREEICLVDQFMPNDVLSESEYEASSNRSENQKKNEVLQNKGIFTQPTTVKATVNEISAFAPKLENYVKTFHAVSDCVSEARTTLRLPEKVSMELQEILSMLNCTRKAVSHEKFTFNQYIVNILLIHLKENKEAIFELKKTFNSIHRIINDEI